MGLLKKIGSAVWNGGKKAFSWALRHGPVLASLGVGLGAIPALAPFAKFIPLLFGQAGVEADPNLSESTTVLVTQLVLLVGAIRKLLSNYNKYQAKKAGN